MRSIYTASKPERQQRKKTASHPGQGADHENQGSGTPDEGLTVKQEIKAIRDAMKQNDLAYLARHGGFGQAMQRAAALHKLPEAKLTAGVSIDDYSTWRAVRFADRDEVG